MHLLGGIIGAAIGGLIGAAIWAGISYGTGYEIGWIAWGVGGLVGFGHATGNRDGGALAGVIAVVITIVALLGGKYASVELSIRKAMEETPDVHQQVMDELQNEETAISYVADLVIEERAENGEPVEWPKGVDPADAAEETDYPADVWADAAGRWSGMTDSEQEAFREDTADWIAQQYALVRDDVAREGFMQSFGPLDILFFGLAIVTAFRVAASVTVGEATEI